MWACILDIVFGIIWASIVLLGGGLPSSVAWPIVGVWALFTIQDFRRWHRARRRARTIEQFYLQPGAREFAQRWFQYIYVHEYPQILDWEQIGWRTFLRKCGLRRPPARCADTLAAWAASRILEDAIVETFAAHSARWKFMDADLEQHAARSAFPLEYARLSAGARCASQ